MVHKRAAMLSFPPLSYLSISQGERQRNRIYTEIGSNAVFTFPDFSINVRLQGRLNVQMIGDPP